MILPDKSIRELSLKWFNSGNAEKYPPLIEPFSESQVQPASYDVRLGNTFRIFERDDTPFIDFKKPADISKEVTLDDDQYFLLHPGEFVLGVTRETLRMPPNLVARIEGKSSVGRLGLMVHITAGFIDPGFIGPVTLEMYGVHPLPLKLWPKQLIAQISFQYMAATPDRPYQGRYQNSTGVEASKYEIDGKIKHTMQDCYRQLKMHPMYNPNRGTPAHFTCTCGNQFEFYESEAEGAEWRLINQ